MQGESGNNYTVPGGGLLKRTTPLTNEERQQYIDFFASKGLHIMPEKVRLIDGVVNIFFKKQKNH